MCEREKRVSGVTSESVTSFYVYISVDITLLLDFLGSNPAIAESCDYFSALCDHHLDYCILTCYGPTLPFTLLARFDKDNDKFEPVQNLESNDVQREAIAEFQLPAVQTFTVPQDSGEDACCFVTHKCDFNIVIGAHCEMFSLRPSLSPSRWSLPQWYDASSSCI